SLAWLCWPYQTTRTERPARDWRSTLPTTAVESRADDILDQQHAQTPHAVGEESRELPSAGDARLGPHPLPADSFGIGSKRAVTRDSFERRTNTKKAARRASPVVSQKRTFLRDELCVPRSFSGTENPYYHY